MKDTTRLRRRIATALACFPLIAAPIVHGFEGSAEANPPPVISSKVIQTEVSPEEVSAPIKTAADPLPNLSGGTLMWCAPRSPDLQLISSNGGRKDKTTSCPKRLDVKMLREATQGEIPKPHPNFQMRVIFNRSLTTQREEDGALECCYQITQKRRRPKGATRGRPLLNEGEMLLANTQEAKSWIGLQTHRLASDSTREELPPHLCAFLAEQWLDSARVEHASVASFARVALELQALAAPPALLSRTFLAARDEVRHAQHCYQLASRFAGVSLAPGPLQSPAPRDPNLTLFARNTFAEACVEETASVIHAMRALEGCRDPESRKTLAMIVHDESEHAALAWATLAWALESGGDEVLAAIQEEIAVQREQMEALIQHLQEHPAPLSDPDQRLLALYGERTEAEGIQAKIDAWREVVLPNIEALVGPPDTTLDA